jgi:hypothetical protein
MIIECNLCDGCRENVRKNNIITRTNKKGKLCHYGYCEKCWLEFLELEKRYSDDGEIDEDFNIKEKE